MPVAAPAALDLVVIQATPFCNIDCSYCYLPARDSRRRISKEVLAAAFKSVLASRRATQPITFVWHAGEPLVLPMAFYAEAFALLDALNTQGLRIRHSFQTNATLLDSDWCDFIARHEVCVGVSLDGPAFLHDRNRKTRSGRGTHDQVMAGIRRLAAAAIPFHVITVLTYAALDHPDALFDFYRAHDIDHVCFNVEEIEGVNEESSLDMGDVDAKFRRFMTRFLTRMADATTPFRLRELEGARRLVASGRWLERSQQNTAGRIVSIDTAGNVATFSPELLGMKPAGHEDFLLGNLLEEDLDALLSSPKLERLASEIDAGIEACRRGCDYFRVCGGGSPSNKLFENGSLASTETLHCRLTQQAMMDVALDHLEAMPPPALEQVAATAESAAPQRRPS